MNFGKCVLGLKALMFYHRDTSFSKETSKSHKYKSLLLRGAGGVFIDAFLNMILKYK
jgi:hypothetical protein